MTANTILGLMAKSAEPNEYQAVNRKFHKLQPEQRRKAIEAMLAGIAPQKAVRRAKAQ